MPGYNQDYLRNERIRIISANVNVGQSPVGAVETFPAKTFSIIVFANLLGIKSRRGRTIQPGDDFHYRGCFAAARQTGQQDFS